MFRILFVLDILNKNVVHAIKGKRELYKPIKHSCISESSSPIEMVSNLKPSEVYIADLNRIQNLSLDTNLEIIKKITNITKTTVNIGVKNIEDIKKSVEISDIFVLSTEISSLKLIKYASENYPERFSVTIDLKNNKILTKDQDMNIPLKELVIELNKYNIKDIIIINLTNVGTSSGIDIGFLQDIVESSSHNILYGGGIKNMHDLITLEKIGIKGGLVATAIHNGNISFSQVR